MNYLRCNKCGIQRNINKPVRLFCGVCSHVLCNECSSRSGACPIDNSSFNGFEINNSMPQKMRVYFEDPNKLLALWQKVVRFQCEQRSLSEASQWMEHGQGVRKVTEEINLYNKYKTTTVKIIEKDAKCIKKMKAYFLNLAHNKSKLDHSLESISFNTSASTSGISLNLSNVLEESGVNLDFDHFNRSHSVL